MKGANNMKTLLTKLQNKRKEEKGFTLVELLVVIAILAILASVSVVGYVGFTQRAKDSNANTELMQAKTLITASLLDGTNTKYIYEDEILYVLDVEDVATVNDAKLKTDFTELAELEGTFTIELGTTLEKGGDAAKADYPVSLITYEKDGGTAKWEFKAPTPAAPVEGA